MLGMISLLCLEVVAGTDLSRSFFTLRSPFFTAVSSSSIFSSSSSEDRLLTFAPLLSTQTKLDGVLKGAKSKL